MPLPPAQRKAAPTTKHFRGRATRLCSRRCAAATSGGLRIECQRRGKLASPARSICGRMQHQQGARGGTPWREFYKAMKFAIWCHPSANIWFGLLSPGPRPKIRGLTVRRDDMPTRKVMASTVSEILSRAIIRSKRSGPSVADCSPFITSGDRERPRSSLQIVLLATGYLSSFRTLPREDVPIVLELWLAGSPRLRQFRRRLFDRSERLG